MTIEEGAHPAVTVIMPSFNSAQTLRESAQSVLDQTVSSLELIIIDDCSQDATFSIADEIAVHDARVRVIRRQERGGPAAARNTGIAAASGRYLAFCDADDLWLPQKLERQIDLAARTGAGLVYSAYCRVDADFEAAAGGLTTNDRVIHVPTDVTYSRLLRSNVIGCLTAVVDTTRTGPVSMPDLPGAEDWALWLRVVRNGAAAAGIDEPLALYRAARPGSHSASRWRAVRAVWHVLRREEGLSLPRAAGHLITDALAGLRKSRV